MSAGCRSPRRVRSSVEFENAEVKSVIVCELSEDDLLMRPKQRWYRGIRWQTWISVISFVVSLSSALFTWQLVRVGDRQAKAAESAADTARKTLLLSGQSFKQEQRAYLWASSFNMSNPPICVFGGTRVCADVHIVSSGRTPATGIHIDCGRPRNRAAALAVCGKMALGEKSALSASVLRRFDRGPVGGYGA